LRLHVFCFGCVFALRPFGSPRRSAYPPSLDLLQFKPAVPTHLLPSSQRCHLEPHSRTHWISAGLPAGVVRAAHHGRPLLADAGAGGRRHGVRPGRCAFGRGWALSGSTRSTSEGGRKEAAFLCQDSPRGRVKGGALLRVLRCGALEGLRKQEALLPNASCG